LAILISVSSDLDLSPSLEIQRIAKDRFSSQVSFHNSPHSRQFFLVASFGRSSILLNEDSVSFMLQSCIGGSAKEFNVRFLSNMSFCFSLFSKAVGFLIYRHKSYKCSIFSVFFDLWGNGGPNWLREHRLWLSEEEASWTHVSSKSHKKSFVEAVTSSLPQSSSHSVFTRLDFSKVPDANLRPSGIRARNKASDSDRPPRFHASHLRIQIARLIIVVSGAFTRVTWHDRALARLDVDLVFPLGMLHVRAYLESPAHLCTGQKRQAQKSRPRMSHRSLLP
jgi:hypothetical protein